MLDVFKDESVSAEIKDAILSELHSNEYIIDEIIAEDEEDNSPLPLIKTIIDRMHNCSSELELKEPLTKIVEEEFEWKFQLIKLA